MIRKILFLLFLGLPGLAFQAISGLVGIAYTIAFCSTAGLALWELGLLLIPMAVFTVGATMQAHFDSIQQVYLSMTEVLTVVLQKTLALLAMMAASAALVLLAKGEFGECLAAVFLLILSCAGFAACVVQGRKLRLQVREASEGEASS